MQQPDKVIESVLDDVVRASHELAEQVHSLKFKDDADHKVKIIVCLFFTRCIRTFDAFTVLVKAGYALEAEVLNRMLFETVVDWLYLCNSPAERVERYEDYLKAWRCEPLAWHNALETECGHQPVYVPANIKEDIKKAKEEFYRKYGRTKLYVSWSKDDMREKAKEVGLLSTYLSAHKRQSQYIHGGPLSHKRYMNLSPDGSLIFKTQPDWENIEQTIGLGCLLMGRCLEAANLSLGLLCDDLVNDVRVKVEHITAYEK